MNGGSLVNKVQFFEQQLNSDGAGGFIDNGTKLGVLSTWCSMKQIKASRTAENLQTQINAVYEFKLRKRANFNPKSSYYVLWDSEYYNITEIVQDVQNKQYWLITIVGRGSGL